MRMVGGAETQNKQVSDPECADKESRGIEGMESVNHTTHRWVPCPITSVSGFNPTNVSQCVIKRGSASLHHLVSVT